MSGMGAISFGRGQMPDLSAMREKMFQKADSNGDSGLSIDEFQNAGKNMPIGMNDTDGSKAKELFGKIDSDQDGSLSKDEMSSFGDKMSSQMQSAMINIQSMLGGGGGSSFDPLKELMGGSSKDDMFGQIDSDADGSISKDEFSAFGDKMKEQFSSLRGNGSSDAFSQALSAYRQGSNSTSSDLTQKLLDMLSSGSHQKAVEAAPPQ